jgi:predicted acyltransferase
MPAPPITQEPSAPARLGSIDAYRGFVMFLMMAEILRLSKVAAAFPENPYWKFLAHHQTHVAWAGCSLHDLIQPSFSFLVGVSLPFSIASRQAKGQSRAAMLLHALWRAVVLVLLGVFLRSVGKEQTNWTFEDTLSQIGFGYVPLFLLGFTKQRWQWAALVAILVGYWLAFFAYPVPTPDFKYSDVGVPPDWPYHYSGLAEHWNKNSNAAWAFDTWFLNLFPRQEPFLFNRGGYATLSFIPTLGTMILGLIAGGWLRRVGVSPALHKPEASARHSATRQPTTHHSPLTAHSSPWQTVGWLVLTGLALLGLGLWIHESGFCPCVKRIWTPSWTLYSGGWCFLLLAGFYAIIDALRFSSWSFPLRVIGANSIAAYLLAHGPDRMILNSIHTHFGAKCFQYFGSAYEPLFAGAAVLLIEWLILYWLYRQKIHIRI